MNKAHNYCRLKFWPETEAAFHKVAGNPKLQGKIICRYLDLVRECNEEKLLCKGCGICESKLKLEPAKDMAKPKLGTLDVMVDLFVEDKLDKLGSYFNAHNKSMKDMPANQGEWLSKFSSQIRITPRLQHLAGIGWIKESELAELIEKETATNQKIRNEVEKEYDDNWLKSVDLEVTEEDFVIRKLKELIK